VESITSYWLNWLSGILAALCLIAIKFMSGKVKENEMKSQAMELGVQALLRSSIIAIYNKYIELNCMPIYEKENVAQLYEQYINLGGNGVITHLVEKLNELPTPLELKRREGD